MFSVLRDIILGLRAIFKIHHATIAIGLLIVLRRRGLKPCAFVGRYGTGKHRVIGIHMLTHDYLAW